MTITLDAAVYEELCRAVGPRRIRRFIEDLARSHMLPEDLSSAYAAMATDEAREVEAEDWTESLLRDVANQMDEE